MPYPKVKISDDLGNAVGVSDNRLDVNVAGATMTTGDIEVNSEFPDAAVITDDFANPTTTSGMSMLMGYDSSESNWNRILTGTGSMSPSVLRVTIADDDNVSTKLTSINTSTLNLSGIKSAVQLIDDAIYADDVSFSLGSDKGIAMMGFSGEQIISGNNIGVLRCDGSGRLMVEIDSTSVNSQTCFRLNGEEWDYLDLGVGVYAVRNDDLTALTNVTDGDYTPLQVNAQGALYTTGHAITGMVSGVNDAVGTSVEDLVGSGSVPIKRIDLMADPDNTGYIWVGDSSVQNDGTGGGVRLGAGDFYSMDINDLNEVHVAATVANEDIMYTYYT